MKTKFRAAIRTMTVILAMSIVLSGCGNIAESTTDRAVSDTASADIEVNVTEQQDEQQNTAEDGNSNALATETSIDGNSLSSSYVTDSAPGSYTLMIYIVGSDLESEGQAASEDILEMVNSELNPELTDVLVYTGGSQAWGIVPTTTNCLLHLVRDSGKNAIEVLDVTVSPDDMGDPDTLCAFLEYGYNNYPADHYGLILWDHGGGPIYGYGVDELYGDRLTISELAEALDQSPFGESKKLDWVGFDACLMADIEVASALSDYAWYLVASQESESGDGWDYSFLSIFNETADPVAIGNRIIDTFSTYYEVLNESQDLCHFDYTLSLMELPKVDAVSAALDALFLDMETGLIDGDFTPLSSARNMTKEYSEEYGFDLVDMGDLASRVYTSYPSEAENLLNSVLDLVVYQQSNVALSNGVSIYYPYRSLDVYLAREQLDESVYQNYDLVAASPNYASYIEKFVDAMLNEEPNEDWALEEPSDGDASTDVDEYIIQLTEEQIDNMAYVCYNILCESDDGDYYTPVLLHNTIDPDSNGQIHIAKNQTVFTLMSNTVQDIPYWPFKQVANYEEYGKYQSLATSLEGPYGAFAGTDPVWVNILAQADKLTSEIEIKSINYLSDDGGTAGKNDADIDRYDYLAYYSMGYILDEATPVWQWDTTDAVWAKQISLDDQVWIESTNTSCLEGTYLLQVVFVDVYGNEYSSPLLTLDSQSTPEQYTETTGQIACTYRLYDDHAELIEASGTVETFEVPSSVKNLPVTTVGSYALSNLDAEKVIIGDNVNSLQEYAFGNCSRVKTVTLSDNITVLPANAFDNCSELTEITLPSSLTAIGKSAFNGCSALRQLEIPENVQTIGDGAFQYCDYLKYLTVASTNPYFKVEENDDGNVLYTSDGKELVACPSLFHSTYTIPEGVETIRDYAFAGSYSEEIQGSLSENENKRIVGYGLNEIVLPSSLKKIGDAAFYGCNRFKELSLPEGLEYIGVEAFGGTNITGTLMLGTVELEKYTLGQIYLGANVRWVGAGAFASYTVTEFVVDEDNWCYSTKNGQLMTKAGNESVNVYGE